MNLLRFPDGTPLGTIPTATDCGPGTTTLDPILIAQAFGAGLLTVSAPLIAILACRAILKHLST